MVVDLPEPVEPSTAECRVTKPSKEIFAGILSALDREPMVM